MTRFVPPTPEQLEAVRAYAERRLSPEEFRAWVEAPVSDAEREDAFALIDWFRRRYPQPIDRLRASRRCYTQWMRNLAR